MGKIGIIIQREFYQRVRKKSFIITTILTPLLLIGMIVVMTYIQTVSFSDTRQIIVVDNSGVIVDHLESNNMIDFRKSDTSFENLKQQKSDGQLEDLYGILVIGSDIMVNSRNVQLYTYSASTFEVEHEIAGQIESIIEGEKLQGYDIDNLPQILEEIKTDVSLRAFRIESSGEEKESATEVASILSLFLGFLIYMFVFLYGAMVMQGVIEEKNSKVIEVMVSSVKPFQLMMGKILGIATVAITQFFIWVVFIGVVMVGLMAWFTPELAAMAEGMAESGMTDPSTLGMGMGMDTEVMSAINFVSDPGLLLRVALGFLVYFIGGYLIYAAMFAAVGSAVSNEADTQQLQLPISIPLFVGIIVMLNVMKDPSSPIAVWFSIIPFTSPVVMLARLPYGVPAWELGLSLALLIATFLVLVWFAGKIYRVGIFMSGKKPSFAELWKWSRYKY